VPAAWYLSLVKIGIALDYSGGFKEAVDRIVELEKAGIDIAVVAEAYSFDAVSQLGYLAAKTNTVELASGVFPIYIRTPSLLAMTAAGLDFVSDGRFRLGIGTSGPQVIEGFHGVAFDSPIGRTREIVEICRKVWRRERVQYDGKHYQLPLPADRGTGLGKPLQLINHPVRERIPITIAALGPKNVELTAEIAEGWQPVFFHPEKAHSVWGEALAAGTAKRDPALGPLDIMVHASLAIGDDVGERLSWVKPQLALYRRHGRQGPQLLSQPGHPLRLRRGRRPNPGAVPVRPQARGHRLGARRIGARHVAGGPAWFHRRTHRRVRRGRCDDAAGKPRSD
jgi:F420-dependent oxidoreductase-like protein